MSKDFLLSTLLSAVWLSMSFLFFGGLFAALPRLFGWTQYHRFVGSLGYIEVFGGANIEWVSLIIFGIAMFIASAPINYYWSDRLKRVER